MYICREIKKITMKRIILGLTVLVTSFINAQIKFEKGYFIDKNGEKKEVYIKNVDWVNYPEELIYKSDINSVTEDKTNTIHLKEFGIDNYGKYISYYGPIDISSDNINDLSNQSEPKFVNESTFLKVIASGSYNLYEYKGKNVTRYYYSSDNNTEIKPLIYKKYNPNGDFNKVATNNEYINQLKKIIPNKISVSTINYNESSLKKVFHIINNANGNFENNDKLFEKKNDLKFNLSIRPGISIYTMETYSILGNYALSTTPNFRVGIEGELILPFNRNKWSIIAEPTYNALTSKKLSAVSGNYILTVDKFSFIDLNLGIRHYMYLNDESKLYINAQINSARFKLGNTKTFDIIYEDEYRSAFANRNELSNVQILSNYSLGAGYTYRNKYSVEIQYNSKGTLTNRSGAEDLKVHFFSIILGYNLF